MTNGTVSRDMKITNEQGLHMRPALLIMKLAEKYASDISLTKDNQRVSAKSVISIMTLAATQGSTVTIEATGPDAAEAVEAVAAIVNDGFDEADNPAEDSQQAGP